MSTVIERVDAVQSPRRRVRRRPAAIGETGTTAAPPAVGNAIYAATGIRLRQLPIDREILAGQRKA
jgi:CO/xanthine dehydrogenase Mo-binding subunit